MSSKLLTTATTTTTAAATTTTTTSTTTSPFLRLPQTLTFLSLRILQSQAPPPNPSHPPLPFLLPALFPHQTRSFTNTPTRLKSGGKQASKRPPPNLPSSKADVDVKDTADYKAAIAKAHEGLVKEVARVKVGGVGRDPEALEGVRVSLEGQTVRLGDLAQVVPKGGKSVLILVGEKEHIKPITSALAQPPHNLNATTTPSEPLTLTLPLPPLTHTARLDAAKTISSKGDTALATLKEARASQRKRLRALELGKLVLPDELWRVEKELDRMNEGAVGRVRGVVEEGRRKVLGSGGG